VFRQGSVVGVIGSGSATSDRGKGVWVIVQLYTHWGLFIFEPLVWYALFLVVAPFHPAGKFYIYFVSIDQVLQPLAGLRFRHGVGWVSSPIDPDDFGD
jgi:hypothetical protein